MNDKLFYSLAAVVALAMIALSLVWPQGLGLRSPAPFGKEVVLPDVVRMERERDAREEKKRAERVAAAAADPIVTEPAN